MRYLLFILFTILYLSPAVSQVTGVEYFIDTDPGYGRAASLSVNAANDISAAFTLPLTSVPEGYHTVYIRSKDGDGHWSHTSFLPFYIVSSGTATTAASEYYIDTDPGYGNAINIPAAIGSDSSLNYIVPLSAYSAGFHTIGIRSKDERGRWSHTQQLAFYINTNGVAVNITSLEYYFTGEGSTDSIYTYQVPVPAPNVDLDFTADLSKLIGDREYEMHTVAINAEGVRSQETVKKIKVCNDIPAKARFDFITLGTQVSFIDSSSGGSKYMWDFGDGAVDSISNPIHSYAFGGNYSIRLVVSNFCNSDTIIKNASILTVQNIYPNKVGNKGFVVATINGSGFTKNTIIKLIRNNLEIIASSILINDNSSTLTGMFNLNNKELGIWSVVAIRGEESDTLQNIFEIEENNGKNIWLDLVGREVMRTGSIQNLTLSYGNTNNNDALSVPLTLVFPKGTNVDLGTLTPYKERIINNDTLPLFFTMQLPGEKDSSDIYPFIINYIPANYSTSINIRYKLPNSGTYSIRGWLSQPMYNSPRSILFDNCIVKSFSEASLDVTKTGCILSILDQADNNINNSPYEACAQRVNECFDHPEKCKTDGCNPNNLRPFYGAAVESIKNCTGIEGALDVIEKKAVAALQYLLISAWNSGACAYSWGKKYYKQLNIKSLLSYDPNEKVGPAGNTIKNFVTGRGTFNYKILFENKSTATAPAQEVIIIDTLETLNLDLSSFQIRSFGFGDTINATIATGLSSYSTNTLLHRKGKKDLLVRVDAKLDTATGILKWRFLSLDPQTREIIDDPLDGFLPPNKRSPEGEGFISYSVMPKADLSHGTEIKNKASIYFDYNEPIVTNEFLNTIDKVNPVSKVSSLPGETPDTTFTIKWSGTDADAGVRSYDVYYSINNRAFQLWQYDVSVDSASLTGMIDSTYSFYSIAKDYAGNIEASKTLAEVTIHITKGTLPITSLPLQGTLNQNLTVSLSWKTLTEANNKGFDIERNTGNGWIKIGFVKGTGNSTREICYSFIDSNVAIGKSYLYRYKQVDFDGRFSYSNIIKIDVKDNRNSLIVNTAPNPFTRNTLITYTLPTSGNTVLRLMDYTGKELVKIINGNQQAGVHKVDFNAAAYGLSSGTYFLNLSNNHESITSKIVLIK